MKKKKNTIAKVFAFLALFGLFVGIVGTGVLFIIGNSGSNNNNTIKQKFTNEQIEQMIKSGKIKIASHTGEIIGTGGIVNK